MHAKPVMSTTRKVIIIIGLISTILWPQISLTKDTTDAYGKAPIMTVILKSHDYNRLH